MSDIPKGLFDSVRKDAMKDYIAENPPPNILKEQIKKETDKLISEARAAAAALSPLGMIALPPKKVMDALGIPEKIRQEGQRYIDEIKNHKETVESWNPDKKDAPKEFEELWKKSQELASLQGKDAKVIFKEALTAAIRKNIGEKEKLPLSDRTSQQDILREKIDEIDAQIKEAKEINKFKEGLKPDVKKAAKMENLEDFLAAAPRLQDTPATYLPVFNDAVKITASIPAVTGPKTPGLS